MKRIEDLVGQDVEITWKNPENDWYYFKVLSVAGVVGFITVKEEILLRGIDDPITGDKHKGDEFWVYASEIKTIESIKNPTHTIDYVKKQRDKLEEELFLFISDKVRDFTNETGVPIDSVDVDLTEHNIIGRSDPFHVVSNVKVDIKI